VHVAVDLLVHGVDDRRKVVAEVRAAEPAGEVDVFAAFDVPDACALGPLDDERGSGDAAGDVALPGLLNAMTPGRFVCERAIFTAFSIASAPVVRNNDFLAKRPGASAFSRSASAT